jgi:hypothetical protein
MLSLQQAKPFCTTAFSRHLPRIFPHRKKTFLPTLPTLNKEKCAIAFVTSPKETEGFTKSKFWNQNK